MTKPAQRPPRLAAWILDRVATDAIRDHVLGDLEEEFARRVRRDGRRSAASRWYLGQALRSLPHLLRDRLAAAGPGGGVTWSPTDVRQAVRSLRRSPTFTAVAVATLALGIGANTVVFTFVHGLLVEPLPVPEPDRLYQIQQMREGYSPSSWLSPPDIQDLRDGVALLASVGVITPDQFIVKGAGDPQYVGGAEASPNYFDVLGVRPVAGRLFGPQDEEADRVVLSDGFWARTFDRNPEAIGSVLELDGRPVEIVGVVPDEADVLGGMELWTPLRTSNADWRYSRGTDWVHALGRLAAGATPEATLAALDQMGARLAERFPDTNGDQTFTAVTLQDRLTRSIKTPLLVLMGAVGLVLVMVCVNLAGLFLARGLARQREVATRLALGVGRGRLLIQLLTEGAVLAILGGGLGVGLAVYGVPALRALLSERTPAAAGTGIDLPVLLFVAGLCACATLVFGLAPAWGATRRDVSRVLTGRGTGAQGHAALRRGLVVGQISLALVLLVGASLLLKSFQRLYAVDLGIRTEGVVTARLPLVGTEFPTPDDWNRHYRVMLEEVSRAPSVQVAAMVNALPLRDSGPTFSFETSEPSPVPEEDRMAGFRVVVGDYFSVLGIDLIDGRGFTPDEMDGVIPAVIVDRAFRERFLPDGAVGRTIDVTDETRVIVGVVESIRDLSPAGDPRPLMYVPLTPNVRQTMSLVVTVAGDTPRALSKLRGAIQGADPQQTIQSLLPMDAYRSASVRQEQLVLSVIGAMGMLALVLAAVGTYGILAYLVSQRTQEIGVRMALGADRASVQRMVLASGGRMVVWGLLLGALLAAGASRFLEGLLFQTTPLDPASFAFAGALLLGAAALAAYLPARRATRVSAVEALRGE